jgi:hypothetical protein
MDQALEIMTPNLPDKDIDDGPVQAIPALPLI